MVDMARCALRSHAASWSDRPAGTLVALRRVAPKTGIPHRSSRSFLTPTPTQQLLETPSWAGRQPARSRSGGAPSERTRESLSQNHEAGPGAEVAAREASEIEPRRDLAAGAGALCLGTMG